MKKIISFLLATVMLLGMFSIGAFAENSLDLDIKAVEGASVRIGEVAGIRFQTMINKAELDAINPDTQAAEYAVKKGEYDALKQEFVTTDINGYISNYNTLMVRTTMLLHNMSVLCQKYELATGTYLDLVMADPKIPQAMKDDIAAIAASIDPNAICEGNDIQKAVAAYVAKINAVRVAIVDAISAVEGDVATGKHFEIGTFVLPTEYEYEIEDMFEDIVIPELEKEDDRVYASDDNKIVDLKYENGLELLLNFNNYQVKVTVERDGATYVYTLAAYGYMVVSRGN